MNGKTERKHVRLGGDRLSYGLLMAPSFGLLFLLTVVPLIFSVGVSLFNYNILTPNTFRFNGIDNFLRAFNDRYFWKSVRISLIQVTGTVAGQMVVGMLVALLLSREFKGVKLLRGLYIVPMMITPVVSGLMWRMLFNTDLGMINYLLSVVGIGRVNWLGDSTMALITVIITDIWMSTPFVTTILLAGIQSISKDYYEAARVDGANIFRQYFHITLPLLKPMILLSVLFRAMDAIRRFDSIMAMTGGGPGNATETLNLYAYNQGFSNWYIGYSSAISFIMLVIIFSLSIFLLSRIRKVDN
jgi:multiple sugar transport system permease protein